MDRNLYIIVMLLLLLLLRQPATNSFYSRYSIADPDESVSHSLKESSHSQMPFTLPLFIASFLF